MADSKKEKKNKKSVTITKDVIAIVIILAIMAVYIFIECYNVFHVEVETITAVTSTVYESVEAKALVIRDEHIISEDNNAVLVPCVADGDKVGVDGNIAMKFADEESAKAYSRLQTLHNDLSYYIELESKTAGVATDVETLDRDILLDVNDYIRSAGKSNIDSVSTYANDLNDKLARRQIIIGQDIDFSAVKSDLQAQINEIDVNSCKPIGSITTEESGIFSSYTDGLETAFDYQNVLEMDVNTLNTYIEQAQNNEAASQGFGKIITSYMWYFCAVVNAKDVSNIDNGDVLDVSIKDSDKVIKCEVITGADVPLGEDQTVLILRSSQLDSEITSMRLEDIEIRYNTYTGFKVPSTAVHVDENGNKTVYALVANQISQRQGEVIYSTKDFVIFAYDPDNSESIRYYDQIITKGKDLYDGKVYT